MPTFPKEVVLQLCFAKMNENVVDKQIKNFLSIKNKIIKSLRKMNRTIQY